jgi:hypothetical protein
MQLTSSPHRGAGLPPCLPLLLNDDLRLRLNQAWYGEREVNETVYFSIRGVTDDAYEERRWGFWEAWPYVFVS